MISDTSALNGSGEKVPFDQEHRYQIANKRSVVFNLEGGDAEN